MIKKQFPNLNNVTEENINNYYTSNLYVNNITPKLVTFNFNKYIIFEEELYYNDLVNNYYLKSDKILSILNIIKNYPNKDELKEIEEIKNNILLNCYNYVKNNITTDININTINNFIPLINGEQKYYYYKNCIVKKNEYEFIKLSKFDTIQITKVNNLGNIINYELITQNQDYSSVSKFCLSYCNGENAYGTLELDSNNKIVSLNFDNTGYNFVKSEYAVIDIYNLPDTLEYIENSSYKYIKRKTDLPYNILYNYDNDTISNKINTYDYYILTEIIYNINYNNIYNSTLINNNIFNKSGIINSIIKYPDSNNLLISFDDIPIFNFIQIDNSNYYNNIYLLIPKK